MICQISLLLVLYGFLLLVLCYNILKYIYGQKRYNVFHLSYFYILSVLIVTGRIAFFTWILVFLFSTDVRGEDDVPKEIGTLDNFLTYFELSLGIQQLFSMVELQLMLRYSCLFKEIDAGNVQRKQVEIFKKLVSSRYCCLFWTISMLLLCGFLTVCLRSKLSND